MPSISETFYEPCTDMWRQGDILINLDYGQEKISLAVLATPQCDIYWEKAEYFLFVQAGDFRSSLLKIIDPGHQLDADSRDGIKELPKSKLREILDHILQHLNGNYAHRFYYLPPCDMENAQFNGVYLDFQKIFTVPRENCESLRDHRIRKVCDPFCSQIFTRYVSYFGRIGTPDFTEEDIYSLFESSRLLYQNAHLREILDKKFRWIR